jgi:hypothetical protein
MRLLGCSLLAVALAVPCVAEIPCTPGTNVNDQKRTKLKHRTLSANAQGTKVYVTNVLDWAPPANFEDASVRAAANANGGTPADPREVKPWKVYKVRAKLWRVVMEDNDCDFHLELGGLKVGKTGYRIIAEIPNDSEYEAARDALVQALTAAGKTISPGKDVKLDTPIIVEIRGYPFYDSAHYTKTNPKKGNKHGTIYVNTLWELHPAWSFKAE